MSHLTIEEMDKINFLITEVSLECLGNKFYDVFGNQSSSLLHLISLSSMEQNPAQSDFDCDLWKTLTTEKAKPVVPKETQVLNETRQKRRASLSDNNGPDLNNDPESLLVPMEPKPNKIQKRRSTIMVQALKPNKPPAAISLPRRKPTTFELPQTKPKTVAEIKQCLKRDIDLRFHEMRKLSEAQEEKYRTLNINTIMDDFYKAEKKSLFTQCNTLIQFIKCIQQNNTSNLSKISNLSQAILELQKEF